MYEIRPESIKTFIQDRNVKLPRFQRKQTWDEKKNFQLCISLFKEYPIGVCILSVDEAKGKVIRWLLDGRQRRNALTLMYEDPENIYNWARKFIGFKNGDQLADLEEKFWAKIDDYIEAEPGDEQIPSAVPDESDESECPSVPEETHIHSSTGLDFLLDIIKIVHNKQAKKSGFTRPFDFTAMVSKLPYIVSGPGGDMLSSKRVKIFIDEYRTNCDAENKEYDSEEAFIAYLGSRATIENESKLKAFVHSKWEDIKDRIIIVERIEALLAEAKIGMIEVKNLSPADAQKIFNIINTEGEKLTAVEVMSAKPHWNVDIAAPSQETKDAVSRLYSQLGTVVPSDVVRWDIPATLLDRIGSNIIFRKFGDTKTDFEKVLTYGFKVTASIYAKGVKKENIEGLCKEENLGWARHADQFINDLKTMLKILSSYDYFKYLNSWRTSIMELTSDAIALNFLALAYFDWERKGKPIGSNSDTKRFQKNCFILWDKLIYEYIYRQWWGASDQKIANNISAKDTLPDVYEPVPTEKWHEVLRQIFECSKIENVDISKSMMTVLLYHFYCLQRIQGPDTDYEIEVDHIIPQTAFNESIIDRKDVIQHNLLNLGLLPKDDNVAKSNKRLNAIFSSWLKDQIVKYEFIPIELFNDFSDIGNYEKMFESREDVFYNAYGSKRTEILNN